MADSDLIVALVALATSVVALIIATTQLAADVFATAEGRRKTSEAVMGPLGKLTARDRRWRELRFEVTYVSPHLLLDTPILKTPHNLTNSVDDEKITNYVRMPSSWHNDGWQTLLHKIHESSIKSYDALIIDDRASQSQYASLNHWGTVPGITLRSQMWDLLPDDVGKAVASTELFDILVIARRLGAVWHDWKSPSSGLRAEGNGHVFSSTNIRGLGFALSYQYVGESKTAIRRKSQVPGRYSKSRITCQVWDENTNKFMFGICPGNTDFDLDDFVIRDLDDLVLIWNNDAYLDIHWQHRKIQKDGKEVDEQIKWADLFKSKRGAELRHATNDLISLVCPMIRPSLQQRMKARLGPFFTGRALLPCPINLETMFQGFMIGADGDLKSRKTFLRKFEQELGHTSSKRVRTMLDITYELAGGEKDGETFNMPDRTDHSGLSQLLDRAQDGYEETTNYFDEIGQVLRSKSGETANDRSTDETKKKSKETSNVFYKDLARAHLSRSPLVHGDAPAAMRKGVDRERERGHYRRRIRTEQVWQLFDNIGHFQKFMSELGYSDGELVKEAWIVLFFRGMCWSLCHTSDELGRFLPTEYYGSQMPIYLM